MAAGRRKKRFLLCVRNRGCADLELRKVYEALPDARGMRSGYVRVIDESGDDYLYPSKNFVALELPRDVQRVLAKRPRKRTAA